MVDFKRPSTAEINSMNNATLKTTLKEVLKKFDEMLTKLNLKTDTGAGDAHLTNTLLEQILDEMKKFNEERDSIKVKLNEVQESNALLLETVAQQQRFLEEIDNEKRPKTSLFWEFLKRIGVLQ